MKHLGDITKINGAEIEPVWCIIGGSPCQDLSTAGLRKGLAGERSGLFLHQIRIIKEMRSVERYYDWSDKPIRLPRYAVWENVPGALSSGTPKGADFRAVLEHFARIAEPNATIPLPQNRGGKIWEKSGYIEGDGYSIAWRIHDAQYWGRTVKDPTGRVVKMGTPQRRRRIALVADFGGYTAAEILFERESLPGHPKQSIEEGQGITHNIEKRIREHDTVAIEGNGTRDSHKGDGYALSDVMFTLNTTEQHKVAYGIDGYNATITGDQSACLGVNCGMSTGRNGVAFGVDSMNQSISAVTSPTNVQNPEPGINHTLTDDSRNYICKEEPTMIEMTSTKNTIVEDGISPTLTARMGTGGNQVNAVCQQSIRWIVRRLTPLECTRLQGFPDGWLNIGDWIDSKGKKHSGDSDAPKYKALGNSICLPYWAWMLRNMARHLPERATLGSLFDGIGGFPLCWERIHGRGTARWASEIEEFPIAVTKVRFGTE